jgi:hypothetical protein
MSVRVDDFAYVVLLASIEARAAHGRFHYGLKVPHHGRFARCPHPDCAFVHRLQDAVISGR